MSNVREVNSSLHLPNGNTAQVTHVGDLKLNNNLFLDSVLCVPSFSYNLLSITKLAQSNNCTVVFDKNACLLHDHALKTVKEIGKQQGGLYLLHSHLLSENSIVSVCNSTSQQQRNSGIWHARLGHPSYSSMKFLPSHMISSESAVTQCDMCHLAKQTRTMFPDSHTEYVHLFDLIHVDLWGPYKHKTHGNCAYFLTIVEAKSRARWTYLLVDKCQVYTTLCTFFAYVQNQFTTSVKILRSDNGSEFVNKCLTAELARLGIVH